MNVLEGFIVRVRQGVLGTRRGLSTIEFSIAAGGASSESLATWVRMVAVVVGNTAGVLRLGDRVLFVVIGCET